MKLLIPHPEVFNTIYSHYYSNEIDRTGQDRFVSSHWRSKSSKFVVEEDSNGYIKKIYGDGFGEMKSNNILKKLLVYLGHFSYLIRLDDKLEIIRLSKIALKICKKMGFYFSFDVFKQVCSLALINRNYVTKQKRLNFLIIGDGYGFLSSLIKAVYPNSTIILIDIGKTLLFQSFYCQLAHPSGIHRSIFDEDMFDVNNISSMDFIYCPTEHIQKLEKIKYDVAINIASMQEMNYETIRQYFSMMRSSMNENNLFYCCNRELKKLIGGEVIEFDKFPWKKDDKFLVDEYCPWYKYAVSTQKIFNIIKLPLFTRFEPVKHRLTILARRS